MRRPPKLCENRCVHRHSAAMRAVSALLSGLFALSPAAWAAAPKTSVLVLPYASFPGVPDGAAPRILEILTQELKGRDELKLASLKVEIPKASADPAAQARAELGKAAQQAQKSRHAAAAESLQKAIGFLTSKPSILDEAKGALLSDAALQLAVERLASGDEDGGDAALSQLVRLSPERQLNAADYPPAFLVELSGMRKRMLAAPRGALRVLAPPGSGETRVFVDGRPFPGAPVVVKDLIPGEHFVRVDRGAAAWGEKVIVIAGVETRVAPQPGVDGPSAELTGALLTGELDRAAVMTAGRLARAAGAQAAVFGAVLGGAGFAGDGRSPQGGALKTGDGLSVRSFLCLAKGDRVYALPSLQLDAELLGGVVQMVKVGDEVVAKLATPPALELTLPLSLSAPLLPAAEAEAAPAPQPELAIAPLVGSPPAAPAPPPVAPPPEAQRRVAVPGAPVPAQATAKPAPQPAVAVMTGKPAAPKPVDEPPSRALVIPRQPTPDDGEPAPTAARPVKVIVQMGPQPKRMEALEPERVKTIREAPPEPRHHTALWIVAGVLVAGGLAAGGYFLYQSNQTPSTSTVNAQWPH